MTMQMPAALSIVHQGQNASVLPWSELHEGTHRSSSDNVAVTTDEQQLRRIPDGHSTCTMVVPVSVLSARLGAFEKAWYTYALPPRISRRSANNAKSHNDWREWAARRPQFVSGPTCEDDSDSGSDSDMPDSTSSAG